MNKDKDSKKHVRTAGSAGKSSRSSQGAGQILNELSRRNTVGKAGPKRQGRSMAGLMVFILMLPFLGAALFLAWQQYLLQTTVAGLQQENKRLASELASQSDTLAELRQEVNTLATIDAGALQETDAALRQADSDLGAELESLRQELARLESGQRTDSAMRTDPELVRLFTDLLDELGALEEATEEITEEANEETAEVIEE